MQDGFSVLRQGINSVTLHCAYLLKKRITISIFVLLIAVAAYSQEMRFSIATDLGIQRSIKKDQRFWTVGQTINAIFNMTPKEGVYIWFSYYTNGNFKNNLTATAKSLLTTPQQINYINSSKIRFKQISIGWRKYIVGACDIEQGWNLYASAGLGLLPGRVSNVHSTSIDTALYNVPVLSGVANFKRLTADLALGYEKPIGADFFLYAEGKIWIPASDYPSKYIFVNDNAPLTAMFDIGLRILF